MDKTQNRGDKIFIPLMNNTQCVSIWCSQKKMMHAIFSIISQTLLKKLFKFVPKNNSFSEQILKNRFQSKNSKKCFVSWETIFYLKTEKLFLTMISKENLHL